MLLTYSQQISIAGSKSGVCTDRFTSSLTYFSRSQGSKCKDQILGKLGWHKSYPLHTQTCTATDLLTSLHTKNCVSLTYFTGHNCSPKMDVDRQPRYFQASWAPQPIGCLFRFVFYSWLQIKSYCKTFLFSVVCNTFNRCTSCHAYQGTCSLHMAALVARFCYCRYILNLSPPISFRLYTLPYWFSPLF